MAHEKKYKSGPKKGQRMETNKKTTKKAAKARKRTMKSGGY